MNEEELLEQIDEYSSQMQELMNKDEDAMLIECENIFIKYIEVYEQLLQENVKEYAEEVANQYFLLADFYVQYMPNLNKAITILTKKLHLLERMVETMPQYLEEIGYTYVEMAEVYENFGDMSKAEAMYRKAKKIKSGRI